MATAKPFVQHVRDITHKPGESRELSFDATFGETVGEGLAVIPGDAPVHVSGLLESVHEGILATGQADTTATAECSRCLDPVTLEVEIDFTELFAYDRSEDSDLVVAKETIDLEQIVRDAAVLALPFQPVCRPDCAGLNPETGEKLEPGTQWSPPEQIDPRWAALQGFQTSEDVPADTAGDPNKE